MGRIATHTIRKMTEKEIRMFEQNTDLVKIWRAKNKGYVDFFYARCQQEDLDSILNITLMTCAEYYTGEYDEESKVNRQFSGYVLTAMTNKVQRYMEKEGWFEKVCPIMGDDDARTNDSYEGWYEASPIVDERVNVSESAIDAIASAELYKLFEEEGYEKGIIAAFIGKINGFTFTEMEKKFGVSAKKMSAEWGKMRENDKLIAKIAKLVCA